MALTPFTVNKIVLVGASITSQSFNEGTIRVLETYISQKYGITLTIVDEAVAGSPIADIRANIDTILSRYTGESNTHFVIHALGNDVGNGEFLDQGEGKQQQLREDLEYVYDAVQTAGHKLIQSSLTFRNYEGTTIDEGLTISNELQGSYTFIRDLIVPVMQTKAPEYLYDRNGQQWPMIDAYNASRNVYKAWRAPDALGDYVHPSKWARMIHALTLIESAVEISLGMQPPVIPRRDYTVSPEKAPDIDVILRFNKKSAEGVTTANINSMRDAIPTGYEGPFTFENIIDTDGNLISGLKAYTYINYSDGVAAGNSADPTNDETSLDNNLILSSAAGVNDGSNALYVVVDGLEANKEYEISYVAAADPSRPETDAYYWPHDGIESQNQVLINAAVPSPQDNITTANGVSDASGRIVFSVSEESTNNNSYLSGLRIKSGTSTGTPTNMSKEITLNFGYAANKTIPLSVYVNSMSEANHRGHVTATFDVEGEAVVDLSALSVNDGDTVLVVGSTFDTTATYEDRAISADAVVVDTGA